MTDKELKLRLKLYAKEDRFYFVATSAFGREQIYVCFGADELNSVKRFCEEAKQPYKTYVAGKKPAIKKNRWYELVTRTEQPRNPAYRYA